jgi:hypothetical protein
MKRAVNIIVALLSSLAMTILLVLAVKAQTPTPPSLLFYLT